MKQISLLALLFFLLTNVPGAKANNVDVMQDCQDSLSSIALEMAFFEILGVDLTKEQLLEAVKSVKENKNSPELQSLNKTVEDVCVMLRDEIRKSAKEDKSKS